MAAYFYKHNTGSAQETRWATPAEIAASTTAIDLHAERYGTCGIPIICDTHEAYVDGSDTHTLIFGATGSKKTRLFCMPLLNMMAKAGESFVVTDPKGELYAKTSGLVKKLGYKTVVLNFRDIGRGDSWNPLDIPHELWREGKTDEAGLMLSDFISAIADRQVRNNKDAFWPEAAQSVALAASYVLMEAAKKKEINMVSLSRLCSAGSVQDIKKLVEKMQEDSIPAINFQSTVCIRAEVTSSGILSVLYGMLRIFNMNRKLSSMLSETSFDMRRIGREKTAVYIIVPDEKTTFHFLATAFIKQVYEVLVSEAQKEANRQLPVRVNFLLDEFCNMPTIPDMPNMISAARSRNIRYYLIAQSMNQLRAKYGEDANTIKGNCDNWVFLTSRELALLEEISELCGSIRTESGVTRRLISVSELQRLDKSRGEALILRGRNYPFITELPDIDEYETFSNYPEEIPEQRELPEVATFSLSQLLTNIRHGLAVAPFPSEEHKMEVALAILREERSRAGLIPDPNEEAEEDNSFAARMRRRRLAMNGEENTEKKPEPPVETPEEKAVREAANRAKTRTYRAKARKRVTALMGEAFADYCFSDSTFLAGKSPLENSDDDDDDDSIF